MRQCSDDGAEDDGVDDIDDADDDVVEDIDDADDAEDLDVADDVVDEAVEVDDFDAVSVSLPARILIRQFSDDGAEDDGVDDIDDADDDVVEDIDDADDIDAADDGVGEADAVDAVSVSRPTRMLVRQFPDDDAVDDR